MHDYLLALPTAMTTVRDLDRRVAERHLLTHPFYVAWSAGTLPRETLRAYAGQYDHFESNFPRFVAAAYARLPRPQDRRVLLENLMDEEGRSPTHPELWADFARAIGAPRGPVPPLPATSRLIRTYERETVRGTAASALGALYAYESQFPAVAREKSRGLRANYGIRSREAHEFFRVHSFADVAHASAERRLLSGLLRGSPASGAEAERGLRASIGAWWGFLDAFTP